jgi:uncharacterized protein (DUF58 family)
MQLSQKLRSVSSRPYFNFINKRSGPYQGNVRLTRDRVYILPTRLGLIFSLLLIVLLIGSINYEKSLGYMLTFLLAAIGNTAMIATWRNIAGLELKALPTSAVFCGEDIHFVVQLINTNSVDRHAITIQHQGLDFDTVDCAANDQVLAGFRCHSQKRGRCDAGKFKLYTQYPTGLFIAWTWLDLSMQAIVYPTPEPLKHPVNTAQTSNGDSNETGSGQEHFSHLRKYHHGDSMHRVSWKAVARTEQLLTKQFSGANPAREWIDWSTIDARNYEQRLSIMTALVMDAHQCHRQYGLRLPDRVIAPNRSNAHYHRCLRALALFDSC